MSYKRLESLRKYLLYIDKRIAYIKALNNGRQSNESRYWQELKGSIKDWGKSHRVYYEVLCGRLNLTQAVSLFGMSERTVARMFTRQREQLIEFIEKKEDELKNLYPHIPMTDIFEDCIQIEGGINNERT